MLSSTLLPSWVYGMSLPTITPLGIPTTASDGRRVAAEADAGAAPHSSSTTAVAKPRFICGTIETSGAVALARNTRATLSGQVVTSSVALALVTAARRTLRIIGVLAASFVLRGRHRGLRNRSGAA